MSEISKVPSNRRFTVKLTEADMELINRSTQNLSCREDAVRAKRLQSKLITARRKITKSQENYANYKSSAYFDSGDGFRAYMGFEK